MTKNPLNSTTMKDLPPRPPPPSLTATTFLFLILLISTPPLSCTCSLPLKTNSHCPPFTSSPPFPFSTTAGCGHPSFQIHCSTPLATISINNISFSLLHYQPNSTSLFLSPTTTTTTTTITTSAADDNHRSNCTSSHSLSIPTHPINLSDTPFRATDSFCSRLFFLRPCSPPNVPKNCTECPWECKLVKDPLQLIHTCGSPHAQVSKQGCQPDILGFLDRFLRIGIEMEWDEQDEYFSNCKACKSVSNGVCGFNSSDPKKPFVCFRQKIVVRERPPNRIAIMATATFCLCFLLVVLVTTYIARWRKKVLFSEDPAVLYLHRHRSASLLPPVFTYEELESSTNNFDPNTKLGDGGFGSVYLGKLNDDRVFAIKYLHKHRTTFSTKSFCNEILILSTINHPNLVKLHGYCSDPRGLLLVYEYVPNGTLSDHLHGHRKGSRSLTWQLRIDAALQTAMAIEYLHCSVIPPVVHRDITSNNIFVERDMRVKLGDFGMSRLLVCPENPRSECVWTGPQGTPGYLDPDYHKSFRLTEKSDIYSFGVVLLELITGMRAVDQRREKREMALAEMAVARIQMGLLGEVVDPALAAESGGGVGAVAELAFRCVAADKDDRPDAREVVAELRRIRGRTHGSGGGSVGPVRVSSSTNIVAPDGLSGP